MQTVHIDFSLSLRFVSFPPIPNLVQIRICDLFALRSSIESVADGSWIVRHDPKSNLSMHTCIISHRPFFGKKEIRPAKLQFPEPLTGTSDTKGQSQRFCFVCESFSPKAETALKLKIVPNFHVKTPRLAWGRATRKWADDDQHSFKTIFKT